MHPMQSLAVVIIVLIFAVAIIRQWPASNVPETKARAERNIKWLTLGGVLTTAVALLCLELAIQVAEDNARYRADLRSGTPRSTTPADPVSPAEPVYDNRLCAEADTEQATSVIKPMITRGLASVDIDGVNISAIAWDFLPTVETKRTLVMWAGVYRACVWWADQTGEPLATTDVDVFNRETGREIATWGVLSGFKFR